MALGWNFPGGGFAFVRFFFFLIRFGQPGKEATLQVFFFFLSLSLVYLFHSVRFPSYFWVHIFFFVFFFCVWFTSAGNPARTERWTVQCPLRVGRATVAHSKWAGRWRPVCVCVQRTASDGVMTRDWMQNFLDESATVSEIVPVHLLLTNSWLN